MNPLLLPARPASPCLGDRLGAAVVSCLLRRLLSERPLGLTGTRGVLPAVLPGCEGISHGSIRAGRAVLCVLTLPCTSVMPKVWGFCSGAPQEHVWLCSLGHGRDRSSPAPSSSRGRGESNAARTGGTSPGQRSPVGSPSTNQVGSRKCCCHRTALRQGWGCGQLRTTVCLHWAVGTAPLSLVSNYSCLCLGS